MPRCLMTGILYGINVCGWRKANVYASPLKFKLTIERSMIQCELCRHRFLSKLLGGFRYSFSLIKSLVVEGWPAIVNNRLFMPVYLIDTLPRILMGAVDICS